MSYEDEFYTEKELCGLLKVSRKTLYNWRQLKIGPEFVELPALRYPKKSTDKWFKDQLVHTDTKALILKKRV